MRDTVTHVTELYNKLRDKGDLTEVWTGLQLIQADLVKIDGLLSIIADSGDLDLPAITPELSVTVRELIDIVKDVSTEAEQLSSDGSRAPSQNAASPPEAEVSRNDVEDEKRQGNEIKTQA